MPARSCLWKGETTEWRGACIFVAYLLGLVGSVSGCVTFGLATSADTSGLTQAAVLPGPWWLCPCLTGAPLQL